MMRTFTKYFAITLALGAGCDPELRCKHDNCGLITRIEEPGGADDEDDSNEEIQTPDAGSEDGGMEEDAGEHHGTCDGVRCPSGTSCLLREHEAACEYEEVSPWLVYVADDRSPLAEDYSAGQKELFGLPMHLVSSTVDPVVLSQGAVADGELGVSDFRWAPDRTFAVFLVNRTHDVTLPTADARVYKLSFGNGVPDPAEMIDLPQRKVLLLNDIALDSSALLTSSQHELFLSRFEGENTTKLVLALGPQWMVGGATFCADRRYAVVRTKPSLGAGNAMILLNLNHPDESQALAPQLTLSPDRRFMAEHTDGGGVRVIPCGEGAASFYLSDTLSIQWSSDGRYIAYQEESRERRLVITTDSGLPLWNQAIAGSSDFTWSPSEPKLLFSEGPDPLVWHVVNIEDDTASVEPVRTQSAEDRFAWIGGHHLASRSLSEHALSVLDLSAGGDARHVGDRWEKSFILSPNANVLVGTREKPDPLVDNEIAMLDLGADAQEPQFSWSTGAGRVGIIGLAPDLAHVLVSASSGAGRSIEQLWSLPLDSTQGSPVKVTSGTMFVLDEQPEWEPGDITPLQRAPK